MTKRKFNIDILNVGMINWQWQVTVSYVQENTQQRIWLRILNGDIKLFGPLFE